MNSPTGKVIVMTDEQKALITQFDLAVPTLLDRLLEKTPTDDAAQIVASVLTAHLVNVATLGFSTREQVRAYVLRLLDWHLSRWSGISIAAPPKGSA